MPRTEVYVASLYSEFNSPIALTHAVQWHTRIFHAALDAWGLQAYPLAICLPGSPHELRNCLSNSHPGHSGGLNGHSPRMDQR